MPLKTLLIAAATLVFSGCGRPTTGATAAAPFARTSLFSFHSDFWVNLHHFLYETARAKQRLDTRPVVLATLADTIGFGQLSPELQADWKAAVSYYEQNVAKRDVLFDSSLVIVNNHLAEREGAARLRGTAGLDTGIAAALDRAAPAYRALWWPRHDAANRQWTAAMSALLSAHGAAVARDESRILRTPWSAEPVRVDVAAYTNWAGAYTTEGPAHINISSLYSEDQDVGGFETLFHEVLHTMDGELFKAIETAFHEQGKRYYRDPTHPFIFYTAGEVTRRQFPGYVPFGERAGLWSRNSDFVKMLPLLRKYWQPYLDGQSTLEEAMQHIASSW